MTVLSPGGGFQIGKFEESREILDRTRRENAWVHANIRHGYGHGHGSTNCLLAVFFFLVFSSYLNSHFSKFKQIKLIIPNMNISPFLFYFFSKIDMVLITGHRCFQLIKNKLVIFFSTSKIFHNVFIVLL